jgi:hypothetical protein
MRIEQFEYRNNALEWQLERMTFSDLTLLVGISGVGKTQILQALLSVKSIAEGKSKNGVRWDVTFSTKEGRKFRWFGEFDTRPSMIPDEFEFLVDDESQREKPEILSETLLADDKELVRRTQSEIWFEGKKTPKLSSNSSVISLLSEEDSIKPASRAFHRILYSDQSLSHRSFRLVEFSKFEKLAAKYDSLDKIQESDLPTHFKLALVYKLHPTVFASIRDRFLEIFPQVTDIRVEPPKERDTPIFISEVPVVQIRESGVSSWIDQGKISSGMLRTLFHIAEMYLWPDGTVILIDEFENSLGVNCIDVLTEDLLKQNRRLQFVLTSHHPYIINNIGPKHWKVVHRKGGVVTTHDASALGFGDSSHEAFIQLINSDTFREGIEAV